jgi:hypothetical protein
VKSSPIFLKILTQRQKFQRFFKAKIKAKLRRVFALKSKVGFQTAETASSLLIRWDWGGDELGWIRRPFRLERIRVC